MTLRAFIHVDLPRSAQVGLRGRKRSFEALVLFGDNPRFVLLRQPIDNQNANEKKESGEEKFAELEGKRGVGGHGNGKNSRTIEVGDEREG